MLPFSKKHPKAVAQLLAANAPFDKLTDLRLLYVALARVHNLGIPHGELGSVVESKYALRHFERTGHLRRIQTAEPWVPKPLHQPKPPNVRAPKPPELPSGACKILWSFGVEIKRSDPDYRRRLLEVCQQEYRKRFGSEREVLPYTSARAILCQLRTGMSISPPAVADARKRGKKVKPLKPVKAVKKRQPRHHTLLPDRVAFIISDAFLDSFEWRQLRYQRLKRSDGLCELCGRGKVHGIVLNVDHIKCRRGHPELALVLENTQVLCGPCNHGKCNDDDTNWRDKNVARRAEHAEADADIPWDRFAAF